MRASIALHQDESGWWIAECLNMPGCVTQAETRGAVLERIQEAMRGWLTVMHEEQPSAEASPLTIEVTELEVAI
jgi:predicted RNase H-like HicB family nuclease